MGDICHYCGHQMVERLLKDGAVRRFCPTGARYPSSMCAHNDGIFVPMRTPMDSLADWLSSQGTPYV
jgi:hypothetical protein